MHKQTLPLPAIFGVWSDEDSKTALCTTVCITTQGFQMWKYDLVIISSEDDWVFSYERFFEQRAVKTKLVVVFISKKLINFLLLNSVIKATTFRTSLFGICKVLWIFSKFDFWKLPFEIFSLFEDLTFWLY